MATFGGITCSVIKRVVSSGPKTACETWTVPGLAGHGAHNLGQSDSAFTAELQLMSTAALVNAWVLSIEALQGSVVTVVDSDGTTYTKIHALQIMPRPIEPWRIPGTAVTSRRVIQVSGRIRP